MDGVTFNPEGRIYGIPLIDNYRAIFAIGNIAVAITKDDNPVLYFDIIIKHEMNVDCNDWDCMNFSDYNLTGDLMEDLGKCLVAAQTWMQQRCELITDEETGETDWYYKDIPQSIFPELT